MAFSRKQQLEDALKIKIQRAILMSKGQVNSDFDRKHPDWVRDATAKNYVKMVKSITEEHNLYVKNYRERQIKKYGKGKQ